jgi:hypothetical protein
MLDFRRAQKAGMVPVSRTPGPVAIKRCVVCSQLTPVYCHDEVPFCALCRESAR